MSRPLVILYTKDYIWTKFETILIDPVPLSKDRTSDFDSVWGFPPSALRNSLGLPSNKYYISNFNVEI